MHRNCKCNYNWMNNNENSWMNNDENCDRKYENQCANIPNSYDDYGDECMCGFDEKENLFPENPMYGQSYVPWQRMGKTFMPRVGLEMGTIFPELVSPYCPGQSMEEIMHIEQTNQIGKGCNR